MEQRTITLAGQEYTLSELPMRQNAAWRAQFEVVIDPLLNLTETVGDIEFETAADLQLIINQLRSVVLRAPDQIADLVFSYSTELQEQRDQLEDNVYESELVAAVVEVLQLAYPFGSLVRLATKLNGLAQTQSAVTSQNSN